MIQLAPHRDHADTFLRASRSYFRALSGTNAIPSQPSRSASCFTDPATFELANTRGTLARFSVSPSGRVHRLADAEAVQ